eukprot:4074215-Amphidinium_carterae.1
MTRSTVVICVKQFSAKTSKKQENSRKHMHASRKACVNMLMGEHPHLVQAILEAAEQAAALPDTCAREAALKVSIDRHVYIVGKLNLGDLKVLMYEATMS